MIKSTRACPVVLILICRAALISIHLSRRSHLHTLVGLFSFPFVMPLSSYSGRATLISICHVTLISIHWSGYAHFHLSCRSHFHTAAGLRSFYIAVSLSYLYSSQAILISIHLSCRSHSHTADVLLSFPLNVWLLLSLSRVAGRIPRAVQGRDVGRSSPT